MIKIYIQIELETDDPADIGVQLAQIFRSGSKNGLICVETEAREENVHAVEEPPETTATTPTRKKRKRKELNHWDDWERFDALVKSEMKRLAGADERMPSISTWNNERTVELPTIAGLLGAYDVAHLIELANKLEMRPPLSALGVEPFQNGKAVAHG
jgi:hypothetical protein